MAPSPSDPALSPGDQAAQADRRVGRRVGLVSLATLGSRVLGLLREAVFAALFAVGGIADAFVFAFRIPNLLRDFFAEGALAAAYVPTLAAVQEAEGPGRARELVQRVLGTLMLYVGILVVAGVVFAPFLVGVVAPDAPADDVPLITTLTRIMFPFLLLAGMASVAMGALNTRGRYFLPALAPMFFNVVAVLGGGVLLLLGWEIQDAIIAWALLVLVGGVAQWVVQLPALHREGMAGWPRPDPRLRDPALRQIVRRMGPVVLSLAGTNVMVVITTALASRDQGWASSLGYAFRLVHLPIGLIGVALGTVVLSAGARRHAAKDEQGLEAVTLQGLRLNWLLALPAAVGLWVLAEPLVSMIFEWGRFGTSAVTSVVQALQWYAPGVVFYAGVKAAAPGFLARGDTRTPMACSLAGIAVNLAVALGTIDTLGHRGLALAVSCGAATNYFCLRIWARRRDGGASAPPLGHLLRVAGAAAAMGLAGWAWIQSPWAAALAGEGRVLQILATLAAVGLLGLMYLLICKALGVREARAFHPARLWRRGD